MKTLRENTFKPRIIKSQASFDAHGQKNATFGNVVKTKNIFRSFLRNTIGSGIYFRGKKKEFKKDTGISGEKRNQIRLTLSREELLLIK